MSRSIARDEGEKQFLKAIEVDPKSTPSYLRLGTSIWPGKEGKGGRNLQYRQLTTTTRIFGHGQTGEIRMVDANIMRHLT